MKTNRLTYIKNILIPCLVFSVITGMLTGALIFLFKISASAVIELSESVYAFVRANPIYLPLLLVGAGAIALLSALILKLSPNCRGGGIPTSIALLRGLIPFHWIKSIFMLFISAMLTYLGGIPLGNEGPSVQMGTAVGRGTVHIFAKNNRAWDRYIMTGGACAGFGAATGAPLSGIFFAFEEAHRRFSPMIFMTAATAVIAANATMNGLCRAYGISPSMFHLSINNVLPMKYIWTTLVVGLVCAFFAAVFTKVYKMTFDLFNKKLSALPFTLKIVVVFVGICLIGFVSAEFLGSGHHLIDTVLEGHGIWYMLLLYVCVRAILLIFASNAGITGGLFVPSLAFGAMIGALCGKVMVNFDVLPREYYVIMVVTGMAAFLGASSRTPITAIIFSAEALSGLTNILPIAAGVTLSFLVIETLGIASFSETVIETKVENAHRGKTATVIDTHLVVRPSSFIVGKEIRDILWPTTCVVLSIKKNAEDAHKHGSVISAGDVLHIHYRTYDNDETMKLLQAIAGKQEKDDSTYVHKVSEDHLSPEI